MCIKMLDEKKLVEIATEKVSEIIEMGVDAHIDTYGTTYVDIDFYTGELRAVNLSTGSWVPNGENEYWVSIYTIGQNSFGDWERYFDECILDYLDEENSKYMAVSMEIEKAENSSIYPEILEKYEISYNALLETYIKEQMKGNDEAIKEEIEEAISHAYYQHTRDEEIKKMEEDSWNNCH